LPAPGRIAGLLPPGPRPFAAIPQYGEFSMIRNGVVFFALAAAFVLAGCSSGTQDKEQVKAAVTRYNQALSDGYKNLNMGTLLEVAEESQVNKAYFHMAALGESRLRMVSQLKDIQFSDFRFDSPSSARVKTREKWDFQHVNIDTQKIERNEQNFPYEVNYSLARRNGLWKVRAVETAVNPAGTAGK